MFGIYLKIVGGECSSVIIETKQNYDVANLYPDKINYVQRFVRYTFPLLPLSSFPISTVSSLSIVVIPLFITEYNLSHKTIARNTVIR